MKTIFVFLLFAWGFSISVISQQLPDDYREGRLLLGSGDYQGAMDRFRKLMDFQQYGKLAYYARYHFAKAAFENGQYELAKSTLGPLLESASFVDADNANYLLALANFRQNKFSEALTAVSGIRDEEVKAEAFRASYYFLKQVPVSVLMLQVPTYEENLGLVYALREKLIAQPSLSSQEGEVLDRIRHVRLPGEGDVSMVPAAREVNQVLEIAVVLPFNFNGGSGVRNLGANNFVFELYRGIMFGVEEARSQGHRIEIKTFDTERNPERLREILSDPFFLRADVIIGPIYPEETQVMGEVAAQLGVPFVNPLSNIQESLRDVGEAFLFRPSADAIAKSLVSYINRFQRKRVAVAFAGTNRDELLARRFTEAAASSGVQVSMSQRVTSRDMRNYLDRVFQGGADLLVVFSDDPNIAAPTFSLVESQTASIPVLVMDSWLYFNFASYEMMESQDFHFIGNNTVNLSSPNTEAMRNSFFESHKVFPGLNTYLGYELIHWLTSVLNAQRGFGFQDNLVSGKFLPGKVTFGFDFSRTSHNAYVPILRLESGELIIE
ncbi:LysM-repeat protein and domain [Lunatimonas lonarensis]|uniref:LysM-repeat protein and domain n=1 Tax=Lunatimonas lonarensis TaxID=1232681 RepID=R7ZLN5_9BACT|nr:ABC transporter substrate-binding protein [Lunatimonas lonarensis]EON75005.1 LysM-repeat protein and domain [Lunatimonas lonarensis]